MTTTRTTLYASAARTATPTPAELAPNRQCTGLEFRIDVSAITSTPSVVFTVQGYDVAAAEWFDILASAAVTATGTTTLKIDPRIAASANAVAQAGLKPRMRISPVHADADSITYSVTAFGYS